jgi:hypothetical protein
MTGPQLYNEKLVKSNIVKGDSYEKLRSKTMTYLEGEFEKIPQIKLTVDAYKSD